jgi:hypothetical protein
VLSPPDLVVYLRASVPTLQKRIALRGRQFETRISDGYLESLNGLYEEWIGGFSLSPVLIVPSDRLDFVRDSKDLDLIVTTIADRLRGRQGVLF